MIAPGPRPQRNPFAALRLAYQLRNKRRRLLFRIWRKRKQLVAQTDRTANLPADAILLFCCLRNEIVRLPYFLDHYRRLGVTHFVFVDNDSDDGSNAYLRDQPDASVWWTADSYRLSRFGMDWIGWLQVQLGQDRWCLTVDADELLVYPQSDTQPLPALTGWLDRQGRQSFGALMIDMYPQGPVADQPYQAGTDPIAAIPYFDHDNHRSQWHPVYENLWIQGGVRDRLFFADEPARAPTLNKVPLVKWHWRYAYVSSTHQALPRRLHDVFGTAAAPQMTGALLHTKFLATIRQKSAEELVRKQHFENSALYTGYHQRLTENPVLWYPASMRYEGWQQLVDLGLITQEDWA